MTDMKLIDSHCHLDFADFDHDRAQIIQRCRMLGIENILLPGIGVRNWQTIIELGQTESFSYALGMHPYFLAEHEDHHLVILDSLLTQSNAVAVGEIGLDFYLKDLDPDLQQKLFEAQLNLADKHALPIILHARKSHDRILQTLKAFDFSQGGIVHAFNGSLQQAEKFIAMGFKLGFGGMLTYERSSKLRSLAAALPLTSIVLETDAPDMSGVLHQGQRNSPEYLPEVLQTLSELRQETVEVIAKKTTANFLDILN